jgi:nucleotide-binding universal stress UspA family protein
MRKVLVPISAIGAQMQSAIDQVISIYREDAVEVHLLNVQPTIPRDVAGFFKGGELQLIQEEAGREELAAAQALLNAAGVPHTTHVRVGHGAQTIVSTASLIGCDRIVMGQDKSDGFTEKLFGTLAHQVRHLVGVADNCKVIGS